MNRQKKPRKMHHEQLTDGRGISKTRNKEEREYISVTLYSFVC